MDGLQRFATLPDWLIAISDADQVRGALARGIPEFATGQLTLLSCKVRRARLKGRSWTAMYQLEVDGLPTGQQEVNLRGVLLMPGQAEPAPSSEGAGFGTPEWRCYLPELRLKLEMQPPDEALPALPILTDPDESRALLERSIRASSPAYRAIRIQASTPKVMRYKPGSRCTVLYRLKYPADEPAARDWPDIVVAKTYGGNKGQVAYDGMRALWESALAKSSTVTIAEPLALVPEMNVMVQGPIREEQTLQDLIRSTLRVNTPEARAELDDYLRKTAVGMVELHRSGVEPDAVRTWEDELAEVRDIADRLAGAIPDLAGGLTPLLARLEAIAAEHPADPPVPTHGTFRPAQVLLNKGQIGFIDFDNFCQAEPALDLSLFVGKIKDIGLSPMEGEEEEVAAMSQADLLDRLARSEAICETFLAEYEKHAPVSRQRIMLWEALNLITIILHSWTKVRSVRLMTNMLVIEHFLRANGL
jgi:hypothetical protein